MTGADAKRLRKRLRATPAEMAALLGMTVTNVYRWEAHIGELPSIGLAQRQLLQLIGDPSKAAAARLMRALRSGGVPAAWACITKPYSAGRIAGV